MYYVVFRIVPFINRVKPTSSCTAALLCGLSFSCLLVSYCEKYINIALWFVLFMSPCQLL